ncbi:MAG TPA: ATP-binding protein [Candidatus Limnocylindrales bacterium]|jgi:SpoVK/Ycf46/Vps4 family AAA+-type ATPase
MTDDLPLGRFVTKIEPRATWDDLVLPASELDLLHQIADQVRGRSTADEDWSFGGPKRRGSGASVLFAGASGAGQSTAAEVLARALGFSLYRIDLSTAVSKYIGETEKNLRRVFDAANESNAILFFDEADALFGKRSEVKDSHDRYANIKVDDLRELFGAFRGVIILATEAADALAVEVLGPGTFLVKFDVPGQPR